jgi:hypothetical protein
VPPFTAYYHDAEFAKLYLEVTYLRALSTNRPPILSPVVLPAPVPPQRWNISGDFLEKYQVILW